MKPVWTPTAATARLISVAAEQWRQGLVDVSGSNRRLFYRPLKVGTLDLAEAAPAAVRRLLSGETGHDLHAVSGRRHSRGTLAVQGHARRAADAIWRKAIETQEETGANPARLAIGAVTFTPADAGVASGTAGPRAIRYPKAPLILLPVRFTPAPGTRSVASLEVDGEPELNSALRYVLRVQHQVELDEDRLFGDADPDGPGGLIVDPLLVAGGRRRAP